MTKTIFTLFVVCSILSNSDALAQCCSAGSGSPIAGGTSQGVLTKGQAEINLNYQNLFTRKFLTGDKRANNFLNEFSSDYSYLRFSYGLSKELTISIESGYLFTRLFSTTEF